MYDAPEDDGTRNEADGAEHVKDCLLVCQRHFTPGGLHRTVSVQDAIRDGRYGLEKVK